MISRHCGMERPTNRSNMSSSVSAIPSSFSIWANTRLVINSLSTSTPSQSKITKPNRVLLTRGNSGSARGAEQYLSFAGRGVGVRLDDHVSGRLTGVSGRLTSAAGVEGRLGFPNRFAPVVANACKQLLSRGCIAFAQGQVSHDIAFMIRRPVQRFDRREAPLYARPRQPRGLSSVAAVDCGGDLKIHRITFVAPDPIGNLSGVSLGIARLAVPLRQ